MLPEEKNRREHLQQIATRLNATPWRGRSALIKQAAEQLGITPSTLYRDLGKLAGWTSGRKPRADKGSTSMPAASLEMVGAALKVGVRQNGKVQLPATVACSVLAQNGIDIPVSANQVNRLLRARGLDVQSQKQASPHLRMKSLHPNHVHQVDPSLCAVYYLRGKQYIIRDDQFYKNKLEGLAKVKFKCWRYSLADHSSDLIVPWYVEAAGESQTNLFDFLMYAWGPHEGFPFYGPPKLLILDKGSANSAAGIKNLCKSLGVEMQDHAPGNARAKGSVENANNIIETQFESRLKFEPVETVGELNAAAAAWMRAYNANLLPNQDTRLRRNGQIIGSRLDLWLTISAEQLRSLPAPEVCAALMRGASTTRTVRGDLTISYRHPQAEKTRAYSLEGCPGINVKDEVTVSPLVYGGELAVAVRIERFDGQALEYRIEPEALPDQYGFAADAQEYGSFSRLKRTELELVGEQLDKLAYGDKSGADISKDKQKNVTPFAHAGGLNAHGHIQDIELPTYMPRRGSEISVGGPRLEAQRLEINAALMRFRKVMGHDFDAAMRGWLEAKFADGVPEDQIDQIARDWRQRSAAPVEPANAEHGGGLRLVGGKAC